MFFSEAQGEGSSMNKGALVAGGGDSRVAFSGSKMSYKVDEEGYKPANSAEKALVDNLSKAPTDQSWAMRHNKDLNFQLKDEPRFFLPDGSSNTKALLEKGTTSVSMAKHEVSKLENVSSYAVATEDEWGIVGKMEVDAEIGGLGNPIKSTKKRSAEVRSDSQAYHTGEGEEVVQMMAKFDLLDDRAARTERITKFHELAPKLIDINKTVSIDPVLLPDDELLNSFRANSIEGIPAQYLGNMSGSGYYNITKAEGHTGLIILSLIRNKTSNKMRFHITLSSATMSFTANESFAESVMAVSNSCCYVPSSMTLNGSTMSMKYEQNSQFQCRDLAIPVPESGFKNTIVTRKSSAEAVMSAGGAQLSLSSKIEQYWKCLRDVACCNLPCVDEMRCNYWCCSNRCIAYLVAECCCIQSASLTSTRSVDFHASETFELGKKECQVIDKGTYLPPAPATEVGHTEAIWKMCPLWTCCCCYEYRGDCACACCFKNESADAVSRVEWDFKRNLSDDVYIEFQYRDVEGEAQRIAAKDKDKTSAWSQLPGLNHQDFLRLRLETTHENVDKVHESARRFVTQLTVPFGEHYSFLEEAKAEEEVRKANQAKAAAAGAGAAGPVLGVLYGKN